MADVVFSCKKAQSSTDYGSFLLLHAQSISYKLITIIITILQLY